MAQDPIGFAGGLNLYGYVGNNPVAYTDPFGLCKDKNGEEVEACRDVSPDEGRAILAAAFASGAWTYSRDTHNQAGKQGDCTDYCESAMRGAGLPSLATATNNGAVRTSQFAGNPDFRPLGASDAPQAGDIVVQGGHAGVFTGQTRGGFPLVLQNGQRHGVQAITFGVKPDGTGRNGLDPVQPIFYRRQVPIEQ